MTPAEPSRADDAWTTQTVRAAGNRTCGPPAIVEFSRGRHSAERTLARSSPSPSNDLARPSDGLAGPDLGQEIRWAARRRRGFATVGALGALGVLAVPFPADAAPASCKQAERYAAQSGSQILQITSSGTPKALGASPAPGTSQASGSPHSSVAPQASGTSQAAVAPQDSGVSQAHVGQVESALVGTTKVNSAAAARMLDTAADPGLTATLLQQAPPTNKTPAKRSTPSGTSGPIRLGPGTLTSHAQWHPGMACGVTAGEVTRATAHLSDASLVAEGDLPIVRVPTVESTSVTEMNRAASVATAGFSARRVELLDGAVQVKFLKAPSLRASMSGEDGGEVRYLPAVVEVSGAGVETARLDTGGDRVEISLPGGLVEGDGPGGLVEDDGPGASSAGASKAGAVASSDGLDGHAGRTVGGVGSAVGGAGSSNGGSGEAGASSSGSGDAAPGDPGAGSSEVGSSGAGSSETGSSGAGDAGSSESAAGLLGRVPAVGEVMADGDEALLPVVPDAPEVAEPPTESAPAGATMTIALGDVRQASRDHAIAARATALSVTIAEGESGTRGKPGYSPSRVLNFDLGVMEAAAVSPEPAGSATPGDVSDASAGAGGGLPITGPRLDVLALSGLALLVAGAAAVFLGRRSRF